VCLPTNERVKMKVRELSNSGVRRLAEMRRHLENFIRNDMFAGCAVPPLTDARYWPSNKTLLNIMRRASGAAQ